MTNATPPLSPQPRAVQPTSPAPVTKNTVGLSFCAEISPTTAEGLMKAAADIANRGTQTIHLAINTPGGDVNVGIAAYNMLRALPCKLITHNISSVNSIGNVVFLAGDERYASPGTTFMFHGVGFNVQNHRFEEAQLAERLDSIRADTRKIGDIIRTRAKFASAEEVDALFLAAATRDTKYAKDHGIIHDVRQLEFPKGMPVVQLVFKR